MNIPVVAAIRCCLMFLVSAVVAALTHLTALAQCPTNVPHINGTWTALPYQMPINPISANLLPNGKVLIVAGSENDASNNSRGAESYRAAVWDPTGTTESSITVQNLTYDVFCSGTAALFDGRSLIVGGTSDYSFTGENRASIFNPVTSQFVQSQNMVDGRWYATATALADGRIMAMSGLTQTGVTSRTIEIYDLQLAGAGWNPPTSVPFTPSLFPRCFTCYPVEECFLPDTAVVCRLPMHGSSTRPREAGRNQPQPMSIGGTAHQFCFLFCRRATFPG